MSLTTNTYLTYGTVGIKEDVTDAIYNIAPDDTPYMSAIGRGSATQTFHEWQQDTLGTAITTNQVIEGDTITTWPAITATVRIGTHLQISRKQIIMSETDEVVDKYGRKSELAYQKALRSAEIKTDMESQMLDNIADSAGSSSTPRITAGLPAIIKTNTNSASGAGASDTGIPVWTTVANDPRTDGTQRTFTETIHKSVLQQLWATGAKSKILLVNAFNKTQVSTFTGIATRTLDVGANSPAHIIGAADYYVSDWGAITVVPERFMRTRDAIYVDPAMASVVYLRKFKWKEVPWAIDGQAHALHVEWGHKVNTEKAFGGAWDLTTS